MEKNEDVKYLLMGVFVIVMIMTFIHVINTRKILNNITDDSTVVSAREIYKAAMDEWINDSIAGRNDVEYGKCNGCMYKELTYNTDASYYIKINKVGSVTTFVVDDGVKRLNYSGDGILMSEITFRDLEKSSSRPLVENN